MDKKRNERQMTRFTGSCHPVSPIKTLRDDFSRGGPKEAFMLLNYLLYVEILATPNVTKIKIPNMTAFNGTKYSKVHIVAYKYLMLLYITHPTLLCKFFLTTLTGLVLIWYTLLSIGNINKLAQLEAKILSHFVALIRQEKSNFHFLSITQLEGESISTYVQNFLDFVLEVTDLEESVALST